MAPLVRDRRSLKPGEEKLAHLWTTLRETMEEYSREVEATTRLLTGESVDRAALKEQQDRERIAYRKYRAARRALLAALSSGLASP